MYAPITDKELKKATSFELGKDYYVKNYNGNWYKGQLLNLDIWHDTNTADGRKRKLGRDIGDFVGIHSGEDIYELDLENKLELPFFPKYFIFVGKKIKTEDLSKTDLNLIVERWKNN